MKKLMLAASFFAVFAVTSCEQDQELNTAVAPDVEFKQEDTQLRQLSSSGNFTGRIAYSADGNFSDRDDIGATPMGLAILAYAGLQNQVVHYDYNSHIWGNGPDNQKKDMTESTLQGMRRFGFNESVFISAIDEPRRAEQNLAAAINQSSASDPLYIIGAGPMAVICEAIKLSDPEKRQYVSVISHSEVNNDYTKNGSCTADGIKGTGVKWIQIRDQNKGLFVDWRRWFWMREDKNEDMNWIFDRLIVANKPDVSDAGMLWYLLKNDEDGTPEKLENFFHNEVTIDDPAKDPEPDKEPDTNPATDPDPGTGDENCTATGSSLNEAIKNLEQQCGVTYDKSKGHDCDPDGKGGWICSTGEVGESGNGGKDDNPTGSNPSPTTDPDDGNCTATGSTIEEAISNLEKACGVTYDKSKGHDCDPDGKGGWTCSTGEI